jgi:hypothetical protein
VSSTPVLRPATVATRTTVAKIGILGQFMRAVEAPVGVPAVRHARRNRSPASRPQHGAGAGGGDRDEQHERPGHEAGEAPQGDRHGRGLAHSRRAPPGAPLPGCDGRPGRL